MAEDDRAGAYSYPHARIQVFCRAPVAGLAKTRLIPMLGESGAAALHEELAAARIRMSVGSGLAPVELWCEPSPDHPFFARFGAQVSLHTQVGADLGARMAAALEAGLVQAWPGQACAVLIGTDCPSLDAAYLAQALEMLKDHDAVIGPAEDGGYGLIGLRRPVPHAFRHIAWGSDRVAAETCRVFNRERLRFALLPLLWDVDRPEDVERYRRLMRVQAGGAN
ncbi:MAG: TIGR04282 family arsenosugar biosynthesis glycosyltransferase [Pseudomonadota bacterium]